MERKVSGQRALQVQEEARKGMVLERTRDPPRDPEERDCSKRRKKGGLGEERQAKPGTFCTTGRSLGSVSTAEFVGRE